MGKLEGMIRDEVMRLARREMRKSFVPLRRDLRSIKGIMSQLRKSVLDLERFKSQEEEQMAQKAVPEVTLEEVKKARFSPRLVQNLRKKLRVTQKELALLAGVSVGAVHQWEGGKSQPREVKKARLVALRKLSRRDIKKLLEERRAK